MKGMNPSGWDWLKFPKIAPHLVVLIFMIAAVVLVAFSRSFLIRESMVGVQEFGITGNNALAKGPGKPPVFAYLISGTSGENDKILRLLRAVYHPRNRYLIHLDAASSMFERMRLAQAVRSEKVFSVFKNVEVIGKGYAVDRTGPSLVAATLHGAAVLLRLSVDWDWFITLSSSDYPVVAQDDLLNAFAALPRHLNFIDHTSDLGWKQSERFDKVVIDPSLFMEKNSPLFYATETRKPPDAFRIFTGSPWVILSRHFVEHCVNSWDNLPRKLLMYFSNVAYSMESYFQTVICNSPDFRNTTVNGDLRYVVWDDPPKLESLPLNRSHYKGMVKSGAAFARWFLEGDPVLDDFDANILRRSQDGVGFGLWCSRSEKHRKELPSSYADSCSSWGDINVVGSTSSGKNLRKLIAKLVLNGSMESSQCKI